MESPSDRLAHIAEPRPVVARDQQLELGYRFSTLQLDRRMAEQAVQILVELEADIDEYLSTIGPEGTTDHFREAGERSYRLHGNALETATYFAASENEQYCSGMYRN